MRYSSRIRDFDSRILIQHRTGTNAHARRRGREVVTISVALLVCAAGAN
jgi:hypothetical protein